MQDCNFKIGVQSYSLGPDCDTTEKTIAAVQACGLTEVELFKKQLDPLTCPDIEAELGKYRAAGIRITACGTCEIGADEAESRQILEFARTADLVGVTCKLPWDGTRQSLALAERLAEEYDVRLALHNHGRKDPLGSRWVRDDILGASSERIGLCLDVGWLLDSGEDPVSTVDACYDRIVGLHFRDTTFDRTGTFIDVVPGTGNLDIAGLMALLRDRGFNGYASIEYAGNAVDRVQAIQERANAIRAALDTA